MLEYIGTDKEAPGVSVTGLLLRQRPPASCCRSTARCSSSSSTSIATYIILKVISFIVPLRMDDATLKVGDDAVHGETAYAIGVEGE